MDMPKKTDRERLADLEARQRMMDEEVEKTRRALRGKYAEIVADLPVEDLTERESCDLLTAAIRCGGAAAVTALRALPEVSASSQPGTPTNSKSSRRDAPATSMA
ncbi:hypothetical protein GCM10011349_39420 [Novosphingobium indicum]|uniref:Uncharacterized protein n=1 Tax=Novosphingobium indicum TaxID=462949 RepID=A0ABQ2JZ45_9SPHN|nr:hypothetical protein GCM10011349_39420 [Novosphingobium indicum]